MMNHEEILFEDTTNQPSKFRTRNWVEIDDESWGDYKDSNNNNDDDKNNKIKLKTTMIRSSLYDYSDWYALVKGAITVPNMAAAGAAINNTNKKSNI